MGSLRILDEDLPAPIESANSVLLMASDWVLVYAMDVDMSCLLVLITFTKATLFYIGCSCLLVNKRKKTKYFSAQSIGIASTKFVGKQHRTMIISLQNFRFQYTCELQALLSPNTMYVQKQMVTRYNQTTLDCTVFLDVG